MIYFNLGIQVKNASKLFMNALLCDATDEQLLELNNEDIELRGRDITSEGLNKKIKVFFV